METNNTYPETLVECIRYFADPQVCHDFVVSMRWSDGVRDLRKNSSSTITGRLKSLLQRREVRLRGREDLFYRESLKCPFCEHDKVYTIKTRRTWQCKSCKKQFSVKVETVFEDSPLGLDVWLVAIWLLTSAKNGVSSHEMARSLGITQKTAWFLAHRIRQILQTGSIAKMTGTIEVDETFVGGKAKNMHKERKERTIKGRGASGKTVVLGILERGNTQKDENGKYWKPKDRIYSQIHTCVVPDTTEKTLCDEIKETVQKGQYLRQNRKRAF